MTDPTRNDPGATLPEGYKDCGDIVFDHKHDHERIVYLCTNDGCSVEVFRDSDGLYFAADAASPEAVVCALARADVPTVLESCTHCGEDTTNGHIFECGGSGKRPMK